MPRSHVAYAGIIPQPNAQVWFRTGASPASEVFPVYDAQGTALPQPITADGAGMFSGIFADDGEIWLHYGGQPPIMLDLAGRLTANERRAIETATAPSQANPFVTVSMIDELFSDLDGGRPDSTFLQTDTIDGGSP
jgi:hypothetical protein